MPDYIYLLEKRLSADQQSALSHLREAAREAGMILFLTGDAVRDLTSGHAVRELEVAVHGNALKLKKVVEKLGAHVWGEDEVAQCLFLCFPGTVRVDVVSTQQVEYPKPGKPVYHAASIHEELRRRDFTANAMALSLNEGSFGLLMDPLNGAADIEARTLRLVSNYGFIEDPSLLIRATRYQTRLGWELDPKTKTRYENAKLEDVTEYLGAEARRRELEQIGHEEEGLKVLQALEAEGWMKVLFPAWTAAKADEEKLGALHTLAVELLTQGVHADMSAAQMQLLTAKMAAKELAALKKGLLRPGFVEEWNSLDAMAAGFAKALLAKENAAAAASYKLFTGYDPEAVLWLGFTSTNAAVRERFELFLKVWPEARQRIPHALMQEMRITAELPAYRDVVQSVFLELIDGRLTTPEEIRAFLEPHSPPAPPPREVIKKTRAKRGEAKVKDHFDDDEDAEDGEDDDEDLDDLGGDDDEIDLGLSLPKVDLDSDIADEPEISIEMGHPEAEPDGDLDGDLDADGDEPEPVAAPPKRAPKTAAAAKPAKEAAKAAVLAEVALVAPEKLKAESKAKPAPAPEPKTTAAVKIAATKAKPAAAQAAPNLKPGAVSAKAKPAPVARKAASAPVPAKKNSAKPASSSAAGKSGKSVKAPVKALAKAAQGKAASAKSAPAKGKAAPAASSRAGKTAPPQKAGKPAPKKVDPKASKKR
jgi:tRNA nucleotidyltransferase/poly(A) polymerase